MTTGAVAVEGASPRKRLTVWTLGILGVTFLAGLLFGYDQGVISGALPILSSDLGLSTLQAEVITSWVTLGALVGALVAGAVADRAGRRRAAMVAGVLFTLGAILEAAAPGANVLTIGRLVTGFGVGFASVVAPLYAAEMSPKRLRGRFVSSYQLAITVGIFIAYLVDDALTGEGRWRAMFAIAIVPGVLLIIGFTMVPESARWLLKVGRRDEARAALTKLDPEVADKELADVEADLEREAEEGQATWGEVFSKGLRRPLSIGIGLAVFQQVTGINAIIYYANEIFARAGFTTAEQQSKATLYAVGLVNVLATLIAIAWIDRLGRRPLLFAGLTGMAVSLAMVGVSFAGFSNTPADPTSVTVGGVITLVALVIFIASFAFSLGPITWTMIAEIFPNRVRGKAVSLATAVNWAAAFLVTQFFLSIVNAIGEATTFFIFSALCVVAFVWAYFRVPETRGRSLEEIQELWGRDALPPSRSGGWA